jgi:hypothetical protein
MTPLHLHKDLMRINMKKKKMSTMIKSKRRAMIKGEMRMMEMRHHIQECTTTFKEITPSTTYLMILRKG